MTSHTDRIIDRRRLKRSLTIWRVIGVVALIGVVAAVTARYVVLPEKPYVALLDVNGLILEDLERDEALEHLLEDDKAQALIVRIDSPGGTFVGGEALYLAIRAVAEEKPVIAVIGNLGTSAAYMAAIASQRILVRTGTITASIGVIMQTANVTQLMEKIGVQPVVIKSDPLKAQPNPMESLTSDGEAMIQSVISDLHNIFVGMVAERRNMPLEGARSLADGRIMTGNQAIDAGLVDAIGGKQEALNWLADNAEISIELPLINITPVHEVERWSDALTKIMGKTLFSERLSLDGALSLWHPQLNL
ncbi:MAG: signal peptide peptidase SppA [Rhodospirillales bacterium]|nr:signal peptide peptidase SppA [Rhodospirillales bacterium]